MRFSLSLKRRSWVAISALIVLLMLPNLIWIYVGYGSLIWIPGLIIPTLLLTFFFAVFGKRMWLGCIFLVPFAVLAPIEAGYIATYLHPTNAEILATLFASTPRETYEYLGISLLPVSACVVGGALIGFIASRLAWQSSVGWQHKSRSLVIALIIALPLVGAIATFVIPERLHPGEHMVSELSDLIEPGYPFGLLQRIEKYRSQWQEVRANSSKLDSFHYGAYRTTPVAHRQVYVLVIGESSRRDRWQLFGYKRATNPELVKVPNLIPIPNMLSSWPVTIMAIPQLLTRKSINDTRLTGTEASILRAMQEAGFETWWISNQSPVGEFDSPVSMYALEANNTLFLNHATLASSGSYDEVLLQPLSDALKESHKDLFIVLHMMGSHDSYDKRYPEEFKHFRPTFDDENSSLSSVERQANSYDNSILYTDHVLAQAINILSTDNVISTLFYVSDHGEALATPTCSKTGHGEGTRYEFEVPGLFWYSDSYAKAFPQRLAAFRANADKPTLSADTFESLFDMAGIEFPGLDRQKSLFSTSWRYEPRVVNSIWQTDFDKAVFSKKCAIVLPPGANTESH